MRPLLRALLSPLVRPVLWGEGAAAAPPPEEPVNAAPLARGDEYATDADTALVATAALGVLANDSDTDADPLTVLAAGAPAAGTVTMAGDGAFTYLPSSGFAGTDAFPYTISDGQGATATASVTVTVAEGAAFSPGDIPNLVRWYDAEFSGMSFGTDTNIAQWEDLTGNAHASQASDTLRPNLVANELNGMPVVRWDMNNDRLDFSETGSLSEWTVVAVIKSSNPNKKQILLGHGSSNYQLAVQTGQKIVGLYNGATSVTSPFSNDFYDAWSILVVGWKADTSLIARLNGEQKVGTLTNGAFSFSQLGLLLNVADDFEGDWLSVLIYERFLEPSEIMSVEQYFAARAGGTINLA